MVVHKNVQYWAVWLDNIDIESIYCDIIKPEKI